MDTRLLMLIALSSLDQSQAQPEAQKADGQDSNGDDTPQTLAQDDALDDAALADLFQMALSHEMSEGDVNQIRALIAWASAHDLELPFTLSGEDLGAQKAEGQAEEQPEESVPSSVPSSLIVAKAFPIQKAWGVKTGAVIEGWVSTEDIDRDYDIVPPEAFESALLGYAERRMPLSSEHSMKSYPIGHGQRVALIRNGQVFAQAAHPTDPAEFEHLPASGSGVYGRFLITEPPAADAVIKGNIGGFSWVGRVSRYDRRPGGKGRIFRQVDPWMESTIAAYPINSRAILLAAKEN